MQPPPTSGWYVTRKGQQYGPYSWDEIAHHAQAGRIGHRDKILDPRTGAWAKPKQVPGLFGAGGAATVPAGISTATLVAVGIVIGLAACLGALMAYQLVRPDSLVNAWVQSITSPQRQQPATSASDDEIPPEGLAYKGTFNYESLEGQGTPNLQHTEECWLWIYTDENGTFASFNYGEYAVDGWPVELAAKSGSQYTFRSSDRSLVEEVEIVVNASETQAAGTVRNTTDISSFVKGSFTCSPIPYDQYRAEVID
jgi:hypothetical protein